MAMFRKVSIAILLISSVAAKPFDTEYIDKSETVTEILRDEKTNGSISLMEEIPNLHLLVVDQSNDTKVNSPIQKRSAEELDDLETAAGTNVLRPLFVYRQQLAYRERVKKGAIRRPGIRPRF
ncbi:uncharacterized protein LOC131663769 [Phymastichus coffea]|uniref:uncharacterized protein LOC131663769 n=1 Tax=Phymastichus coffea TaxID=108790 RepID=UPI00273BB10E|nr:uncharacterized protein LOC131663769 [Phymastichus coffea]